MAKATSVTPDRASKFSKPVKLVFHAPIYLVKKPRAEQGIRVGELNFRIQNSELGTMSVEVDDVGVTVYTAKFYPMLVPWDNVLAFFYDDAE